MADLNGFDANLVEPSVGFDPVPAGRYLAVITASEFKQTKAGTGHYLELTFQVVEGEHKGRLVWGRLNLVNPNPKAVDIARAELSAICRAVGVLTPNDSEDLHDLPLLITVKCKKLKDPDRVVNEISKYEKKEAATPAAAPLPNGSAPPWKRPS
jgi:hypothetical protein